MTQINKSSLHVNYNVGAGLDMTDGEGAGRNHEGSNGGERNLGHSMGGFISLNL